MCSVSVRGVNYLGLGVTLLWRPNLELIRWPNPNGVCDADIVPNSTPGAPPLPGLLPIRYASKSTNQYNYFRLVHHLNPSLHPNRSPNPITLSQNISVHLIGVNTDLVMTSNAFTWTCYTTSEPIPLPNSESITSDLQHKSITFDPAPSHFYSPYPILILNYTHSPCPNRSLLPFSCSTTLREQHI